MVVAAERGWITKCDHVEDYAKRETGVLLPAPKQLRAVIVDLSHADGEKAEVPVDTASGHEGEACLLAKSSISAASTWEHMCEQSKVPGAVKELGPEEEIVLMTLASRRRLPLRLRECLPRRKESTERF